VSIGAPGRKRKPRAPSAHAFSANPNDEKRGAKAAVADKQRALQWHEPSSRNSPLAAMAARERAQFRIFWSNGSFFTLAGVM
jgi:hypothetical protein